MEARMNLTSFFANKCFEYLLKCDSEQAAEKTRALKPGSTQASYLSQFTILPPWAKNSKTFKSLCDGCGNCISACEKNILIINKKGFPQVDFALGSCSFCGDCAANCPKDVFKYAPSTPPWNIHANINGKCLINNNVVCSTCVEQCDKQAIVIPKIIDKDKVPKVLIGSCDGCGACFNACPVHAIEIRQSAYQEQP
jgi:ferredoxin-type protein NapF